MDVIPSLFVGAVWDSNTNQASSNSTAQSTTGSSPDSGTSLAVSPRLVATTSDGGMHSSTLYGVGDFQFFNTNTVAADAGFTHAYKPTEDLSFNLNLRYTRQTDLFTSALNFNNNAIGLHGGPAIPSPTIINPFGTTPSINPVAYNQYTAGGSVSKTWDTWFATLTGTAFAIHVRSCEQCTGAVQYVARCCLFLGLPERVAGISCRRFTFLAKWTGFGNVSAIQYLTRTDTE